MNSVMLGMIFIGTSIFIIIIVKGQSKGMRDYEIEEDKYCMDQLIDFIKNKFNDILKTNLHEMNLSKEEFEKRMKNRAQLRKALKTCSYGDVNSKNYIKSFIRDILVNLYGINEDNINRIIDFDNARALSIQDKFEILLLVYKKKYYYNALERLIIDNGLDKQREVEDAFAYFINKQDIEMLYSQKVKKITAFEDKVSIIVQRIYQVYKGYGVIDEIRDMKIDGVSGGVSGIPPTFHEEVDFASGLNIVKELPFSYDSVWIFLKGKTIHLSFLSFKSENELVRVCKNIYRFNNPGQLSESNGYKVNEMKDGSRVVVARPPFSESWVFFVRKFDSITKASAEDLIVDQNNQLPIEFMKWLIKGCRVTAVTGSQGTGKTTLLMSIVKYINPSFALRIQEMSFELQLRKIYPNRNIVTFRETPTISGQEGLNLQKKTDGTVNILGEVAEAGVSSWMIQMAQVASLFTLFTHHAKTSESLIFSIRNNLLQTGVFSNEKVAEQQVVDVINFDIHLSKSITGHRYIERITEIIPLMSYSNYPSNYKEGKTHEEKTEAFMETMHEFFVRMTDRKTFETRNILIYEKGEYITDQKITTKSQTEICKFLTDKEKLAFEDFLKRYWGGELDWAT
ncbi:MAG: pilus assembly protein CpaF [Firmicutes bacterium HGW-Firmicutes-7]|nr:MAG: pilus assembly protein CpaF [Firmicutes bacterium HGW-Firmicutes-7]